MVGIILSLSDQISNLFLEGRGSRGQFVQGDVRRKSRSPNNRCYCEESICVIAKKVRFLNFVGE